MDPVTRRLALAADTPKPEPVAYDELRDKVRIAAERVRHGRSAKSQLLVGHRDVGKAALLDRIRDDVAAAGFQTLRIVTSEGRSLPALLVPPLREALLHISENRDARALGHRALRALTAFAKTLNLAYEDIDVHADCEREFGLADNGVLEQDLQDLLEAAGQAARKADTALVLFVVELQCVGEEQLAALIGALHRTVQRQLPVILVGTGLPQLRARVGNAKPYAERMFEFSDVGVKRSCRNRDGMGSVAE